MKQASDPNAQFDCIDMELAYADEKVEQLETRVTELEAERDKWKDAYMTLRGILNEAHRVAIDDIVLSKREEEQG